KEGGAQKGGKEGSKEGRAQKGSKEGSPQEGSQEGSAQKGSKESCAEKGCQASSSQEGSEKSRAKESGKEGCEEGQEEVRRGKRFILLYHYVSRARRTRSRIKSFRAARNHIRRPCWVSGLERAAFHDVPALLE